jgi:HSP20 family protein
MTFYYYSPFSPRRHHRMERMLREMQPEGGPCCDENFQPGTQHHMHHEGHHQHDFPIRMDVESREDVYVISALLPGFKPADIEIQIAEGVVSIQGELKLDEDEKATWLVRERPRGRFSRSIELPASMDAENAKASFENGILTLTIPKAAEARPKTIKVNVK